MDQTGNITTGYQLIDKVLKKHVFGLITPLLTDEKGAKYGKSVGKAVWVNPKRTSPFSFYQSFIRIPDTEVHRFLRLFTFLPENEIEQIMQKFLSKTGSRYAQERLAEIVTLLVDGEEGLEMAKRTTAALYSNDVTSIGEMTPEELHDVFGKSALMSSLYFDPKETTVLDLAIKAKCFPNESEAGNAIRAGAFFINSRVVTDPHRLINESQDMLPNGTSLVRVGKKRYYIIKWR